MSLVFPNQVTPEVNWAIPETEDLLTCQYDDGTTVTNCITGATGEVFDSANELGTNSGLSATWSTSKPLGIDDNPLKLLTTDEVKQHAYKLVVPVARPGTEQINIDYEDVTSNDFLLEFELTMFRSGGATNTYGIVMDNGGQYRIEFRFPEATQDFRVTLNWTGYSFLLPTPVLQNEKIKVTLRRKPDNTLSCYFDNIEASNSPQAVTSTQTFKLHSILGSTSTTEFGFLYFKYIDYQNPTASRLWDFNRTSGDVVVDEINGANCTLTNFPADASYVRDPNDPTTIIGYRSGGVAFAKATSTLVRNTSEHKLKLGFKYHGLTSNNYICSLWSSRGLQVTNTTRMHLYLGYLASSKYQHNYDFTTPLSDGDDVDVVMSVVQNGTQWDITMERSINGGALESAGTATFDLLGADSFPVLGSRANGSAPADMTYYYMTYEEGGVPLHHWDCTYPDEISIQDHLGSLDLVINSEPQFKWQPYISTNVFFLSKDGTKDYTTIQSFVSANAKDLVADNERHELRFFKSGWDKTTPLTENFVNFQNYITSSQHNVSILPAYPSEGHSGEEDTGFVWKGTGNYGLAWLPHLTLKNIEFTSDNTIDFFHNDENTIYEDCLFYDMSIAKMQGTFHRCRVFNLPTTHANYSGCFTQNGALYDCIVEAGVGEGGFNGDMVVAQSDLQNCIIVKGNTPGTYNSIFECTGDFNFTNDTAASASIATIDTNLPTYIDTNGKINSAGQSVLTSSGWNGSNVVEWAWSDGAPTDLTLSLNYLDSTVTFYEPTVREEKVIQLGTVVSTDDVYDPTVGFQAGLSISLDTLNNVSSVYNTNVYTDTLIQLDTVDSTSVSYTPTVLQDRVISLDPLPSQEQVYGPILKFDGFIQPEHIDSTLTVHVPTLDYSQLIQPTDIPSSVFAYTPKLTVGQMLQVAPIGSTVQIYNATVKSGRIIKPDSIATSVTFYDASVLPEKIIILEDDIGPSSFVFFPTLQGGAEPVQPDSVSFRVQLQWQELDRL